MTTAPVLWSLAWGEDGELAPQDRFDLLASLICSETAEAQTDLIAAMERLPLAEVCVLASMEVSRLWA